MDCDTFDLTSFEDFESASRTVLAYLHNRLGFDLWMVTRTEGADWIVLQTEDHGYGVKEGTVFFWADSFCSRMVLNLGPRIAPCVADVPAYVEAPIGLQVPIGAYIGVPLLRNNGDLFGTLCAIDPTPKDDTIRHEIGLVELFARLLSTVLAADFQRLEDARRLEQYRQQAQTDALTGLLNRHAWHERLAIEEARTKRYGCQAFMVMIDIDGLKTINEQAGRHTGDELLVRAAQTLQKMSGEREVLARIGGDEFAILSLECSAQDGDTLINRISQSLLENCIAASVAGVSCNAQAGFAAALKTADIALYTQKMRRQTETAYTHAAQ